jgi:hypothetical protein
MKVVESIKVKDKSRMTLLGILIFKNCNIEAIKRASEIGITLSARPHLAAMIAVSTVLALVSNREEKHPREQMPLGLGGSTNYFPIWSARWPAW